MATLKPLTAAMDNLDAWRLGKIPRLALDDPNCGDHIDRGLILLRLLNEAGYDIVRRTPATAIPIVSDPTVPEGVAKIVHPDGRTEIIPLT